ncbi:NucA/NucB deoxyribonuclease domain-containing protein [Glycomyces luteolus]|uniref:NucA/NucB deoxyribonuclease domain-containing protein n=1 Tax=Glycomyces luteolus TaxID=2670330 RepID=A0A9X3PFG5_9ACTN|nr:NucA/NucB deoxyribonuclease domain-containing protein [Glycomyces luteolus]MDA1361624.1 NucA/NucB deoxyribonuclease domain-containing protein [Glycomyces luteolus]
MARTTRAGSGAVSRLVMPVAQRLKIARKRRRNLKPVKDVKTPPPAGSYDKRILIDPKKYPESAKHIRGAQKKGYPRILTKDSSKSKNRRRRNLSLFRVPIRRGKDRDEYPFASTQEGGHGASIKYLDPSDNTGAGSSLRHQWSGLPNGSRIWVDTYRRPGDPP